MAEQWGMTNEIDWDKGAITPPLAAPGGDAVDWEAGEIKLPSAGSTASDLRKSLKAGVQRLPGASHPSSIPATRSSVQTTSPRSTSRQALSAATLTGSATSGKVPRMWVNSASLRP